MGDTSMITGTSGIGYEPLGAVPATRHGETPSFPHRLLHGRYHLIGRAEQPDVVWARAEPLIETLIDHREIPRIVGADSHGFAACAVGRLSYRHRRLWINQVPSTSLSPCFPWTDHRHLSASSAR